MDIRQRIGMINKGTGDCNLLGGKKRKPVLLGNLKYRHLGVDARIILKAVLMEHMDWIGRA
jgi:hypothetical protein